MQIEGKRVLVTGASRGLGHTLAFSLAAAGAREVVAGARNPKDIETLIRDAKLTDARVTPIRLDVTVAEEIRAAAEQGPVDILINNAGIAGFGNPLTMDFADIQNEISVNYLGVLRMVRAFAPAMIEQRAGMIVNVGTILGKINLPIVGTYCATKAALLSLGQALRAYLADKGVRVMTVMPSTIDTEMSRGANVPKLTKEFVASEILKAIREEAHDPVIGSEAQRVLAGLQKDPLGMEKMFGALK